MTFLTVVGYTIFGLFVFYLLVKLGTHAFLRARWQFEREHPRKDRRLYELEEGKTEVPETEIHFRESERRGAPKR